MESTSKSMEVVKTESESKEIGHPADPKSPAVPIQVENIASADTLTETDDDKIILTLESLHYPSEAEQASKKINENQKALEKLDKLLQSNSISRKKIVKNDNGGKASTISVVTVKAATNEKAAPRILNSSFGKSSNTEHKRLLNNSVKSIPSEEDLLAILEGSNHDEEGDVDFKVIDDNSGKKKSTVTTLLLSKNQELRLAADQIKEISRKKKAPANASPSPVEAETNELISSLASEWSDNEKESTEEQNEGTKTKTVKQVIEKRKPEPKLIAVANNVQSSESNNNDKIKVEVSDIKEEKPSPTTGIAPFKRSRVIKKKIIWDPDAPETQFSYASLIKPKPKQPANKKVVQTKIKTENNIKIENATSPKTVAAEKVKPPVNNRKRKESTPEKTNQKLEEVMNVILSDDVDPKENSKNTNSVAAEEKLTPPGPKKGRMTKGKQSQAGASSWDYLNKGRTDEMMIIRRRSSSYSSTTSQRRMSFEQQQTPTPPQKTLRVIRKVSASEQLKTSPIKRRKQEVQLKKVIATKPVATVQTTMKPVLKKLTTAETRKLAPPSPTVQLTIALSKKINKQSSNLDQEKVTAVTVTSPLSTNVKVEKVVEKRVVKALEEKPKSNIEIILKRLDSVVNFIIDLKTESPENTFSIEFIKKFISTLEHLKKDDSCKVVVVSSRSTHFCQGIDFTCLIAPSIDRRKVVANVFAKLIKLLFETLINFNKPIIAAVGGVVSNLGVTMLPLFDMVLASDKCAFEMSYAKIGQIPEGNCILSTLNMDSKYKMKLLYLAEKLTASEALASGLITAIHPTQRFEAEAINIAVKMASLSQRCFKDLKQLRVQKYATEGLVKALEEEQTYLIESWISTECQEKFKELMKK